MYRSFKHQINVVHRLQKHYPSLQYLESSINLHKECLVKGGKKISILSNSRMNRITKQYLSVEVELVKWIDKLEITNFFLGDQKILVKYWRTLAPAFFQL